MIIKRKQWWSTFPPISTKRTTTLNHLKTNKTKTYVDGNQGPGLGHAHKSGMANLVERIQTLPLLDVYCAK
jgi:hypothetical protein